MSAPRPRVSFGLFVRNGASGIRRCLDSLLAQDLDDLEVVVSDNASTDDTPAILREYAARDPRVRLMLSETDLGLIENANRVFRASRGEFFRWIGAEDWLEPGYASRCVAALDADPELIAATSYFRLHYDTQPSRYVEFTGELLESPRPERRFARMLWTFHAGDALYDPIYALFRRDRLGRTGLIRRMVKADNMLAAELSLMGRFVHIPECLTHRWKPEVMSVYTQDVHRRYDPVAPRTIPASPANLRSELGKIVAAAPLSTVQRLRCRVSAARFIAIEWWQYLRRAVRYFRREKLGLTRERLARAVRRRNA